MNVNLPSPARDLEAVSYSTSDGKTGWVVRLPGSRPIATPAYADGMLFVGGGYGSHEFYAVDADTGKVIWKTQTGDDGPTAAVVADGMVAMVRCICRADCATKYRTNSGMSSRRSRSGGTLTGKTCKR